MSETADKKTANNEGHLYGKLIQKQIANFSHNEKFNRESFK